MIRIQACEKEVRIMSKTVQEIFDSIPESERFSLYVIVGYMVEYGVYDFREWDRLIKKLNKEQIALCRIIVESARNGA